MRPLVQKLRVWMPYRMLWGTFRGAENRIPEHEITSKMRPLKQKVGVEMAKMATLQQKERQKCDPFVRKSAPPRAKTQRASCMLAKPRIFGP